MILNCPFYQQTLEAQMDAHVYRGSKWQNNFDKGSKQFLGGTLEFQGTLALYVVKQRGIFIIVLHVVE